MISNQDNRIWPTLPPTTALSSLTTAVQALEAKVSGAAPTVLQSDLDPIVTSSPSLTTSIEALVSRHRDDEPSFFPGHTGARRRLTDAQVETAHVNVAKVQVALNTARRRIPGRGDGECLWRGDDSPGRDHRRLHRRFGVAGQATAALVAKAINDPATVAWTEGLATALKSTLKRRRKALSVERALKGTCSVFSSIYLSCG